MDFAAVTELVTRFLDGAGRRWAVVGGVGLASYGLARTTLDLDVATELEAQSESVAFLEGLGYETLHRSRGYSNHLHPEPEKGRVDFVREVGARVPAAAPAFHAITESYLRERFGGIRGGPANAGREEVRALRAALRARRASGTFHRASNSGNAPSQPR